MLQPRIELGPKRWQRSILPLNYCRGSLTFSFSLFYSQKLKKICYYHTISFLSFIIIISLNITQLILPQYHIEYKPSPCLSATP